MLASETLAFEGDAPVKIFLGLVVLAGLVFGARALFLEGEPGLVGASVSEVPEQTLSASAPDDLSPSKSSEIEEGAASSKTVLDIDPELAENDATADVPVVEPEAGVTIGVLDGQGEALGSGAPNKVQNALENILGGSTVLGGPTTGELSDEERLANLEHDAIQSDVWEHLDEALTVEGFDRLAIGQLLIGPTLDDTTKDAIKSLLSVSEENPEQIQSVVSEIRKLLGL